jgi:hypothetical protein
MAQQMAFTSLPKMPLPLARWRAQCPSSVSALGSREARDREVMERRCVSTVRFRRAEKRPEGVVREMSWFWRMGGGEGEFALLDLVGSRVMTESSFRGVKARR